MTSSAFFSLLNQVSPRAERFVWRIKELGGVPVELNTLRRRLGLSETDDEIRAILDECKDLIVLFGGQYALRQADDDSILVDIAARIIQTHPNPRKMTVDALVQQFISISPPNKSLIETAQKIQNNHTAMRMLTEAEGGWKGREARFIPGLREWLRTGLDPVVVTRPDAPRRQTLEY
jgi:hypothetical protein